MEFAIYTISVRGIFRKYYEIYQEDRLMYRVKRPSFWAFGDWVFTDTNNRQIYHLKRVVSIFVLSFKFIISQENEKIATIEKDRMNNFYNSSSIYGHHTIQGSLFNNEYTISNESDEIAKVSRKRFRSDKKYGIAIIQGHDELYVLSMVIAISIVNSNRKKRA